MKKEEATGARMFARSRTGQIKHKVDKEERVTGCGAGQLRQMVVQVVKQTCPQWTVASSQRKKKKNSCALICLHKQGSQTLVQARHTFSNVCPLESEVTNSLADQQMTIIECNWRQYNFVGLQVISNVKWTKAKLEQKLGCKRQLWQGLSTEDKHTWLTHGWP